MIRENGQNEKRNHHQSSGISDLAHFLALIKLQKTFVILGFQFAYA